MLAETWNQAFFNVFLHDLSSFMTWSYSINLILISKNYSITLNWSYDYTDQLYFPLEVLDCALKDRTTLFYYELCNIAEK